MKKVDNIIDSVVVLGILLMFYKFFITFLQIENIWKLSILITLAFLVILLISRFENIKSKIIMSFKKNRSLTYFIGLLLFLSLPFSLRQSSYWILIISLCWLWIIIAQGINIQFGSAGIINLGAAFFWGIGGYTTAILTSRYNFNPLIGIFLGGIMAILAGLPLIIPILKARGHYLALVTLSVVVAFGHFANNIKWLGGSQGIMNVPSVSIGGYNFLNSIKIFNFELPPISNYFYFATLLGILVLLVCHRISNSWVGLTLNSINENKGDIICSNCMGINRAKWVVISFSIGNFFIGIAGAFFAHMNCYVAPQDITFYKSLLYLSAVILGGMDNIKGVTIGAILLVILPEKFKVLQEYWIIIFMSSIVLMIILRPQGLLAAKIRNYGIKRQ